MRPSATASAPAAPEPAPKGPPRDPFDRGSVQAAVSELVYGGLDQRVPALGGRDALAGGLALGV